MEKEKEAAYYRLFEELIDEMSAPDGFDRERHRKVITEICELFHLAKGASEFYKSLSHEKMGQGEYYCDYDNGHADKVLIHKRIITKTNAVVMGTIYVSNDFPDMPADELFKVDLMLRAILSFISRVRLQSAVEVLGYYDENGYPNLRSFLRYLDIQNDQKELHHFTAIHYNLRHFTMVNREIGRDNGDKVIRNHFMMMKNKIGEHGIVCRLGGDTFLAAFENELLDMVLNALNGTPVNYGPLNEKRVFVSAWVGVFQFPEGYELKDSSTIMDKIVPASMAAKRGGNANVVFYNERMVEQKEKQMRMQRIFPKALENQEFHVYYQPKVDVCTGEIVGAEALCRWIQDGKIISPLEFIPILEQNTDICRLDFYMLDMVCRNQRRWLNEGRKVVRVSVNFSRKHMVDPDFLEHILKIVDDNHVPHEYIEVELTETTTDVEFRDLKRVVGGLQKEGISTSVDDFGMGYSSLNLIREIPWNVLKIDKSFLPVAGDELDMTTNLMYKHVIAMAKEMGLECITEGVETVKQIEILRQNGCRIAQGFHFDKPLPMEEFEKRMMNPKYEI